MSKEPTNQQLERAAAWLLCNEGEDDEREDCHAVAEWIAKILAKRDLAAINKAALEQVAKEMGINPAEVKRRYKEALKRKLPNPVHREKP